MDTKIFGWQSETRPGGPAAKSQPSPAGLGIDREDDLSAVGAALNLVPLAPVSERSS
jgi:hypothetical protein